MLLVFWLLFYVSASLSLEMNDILKDLSWPLKLRILNRLEKPSEKVAHQKPDTGRPDTGIPDTGIPDTGIPDTGIPDTGIPDTGMPDTEMPDTGNASTAIALNISTIEARTIPKTKYFRPTREPKADQPSQPSLVEEYQAAELAKFLGPKSKLRKNNDKNSDKAERRVGISLLRSAATANPQQEESDENDMRLKLFRLMYETVRDSDVKVKRAELIKEQYQNSSAFEIGYLVGDITDKANIITDISTTLKKFHKEWKPLEHINAYEQIANQAIEITHLIDLVKIVHKKEKGKSFL